MNDTVGFGQFLRSRRARLRPDDVGLPTGAGPRRTPGLRREEVATLSGISVDYYTRLEQDRELRPSDAVLDALARVLRLDDDERDHLRVLALRAVTRGPARTPGPDRSVRPEVRQLLDTVRPSPAYVLSVGNDVLAGNPAGLRLLPGIEQWPVRQRNTTRYTFLHPAARRLYPEWEQVALGSVAHLRAVIASPETDPHVAALVDELSVKSAEFAAMWARYDVRVRSSGRKTYRHPTVGPMTLSYEVLTVARTAGHRLVVYQAPPGSADHDAMLLLDLVDNESPSVRSTG